MFCEPNVSYSQAPREAVSFSCRQEGPIREQAFTVVLLYTMVVISHFIYEAHGD